MLLQFLRGLESGEKTPADLLAICLGRIVEREEAVRAWVEVAPQPALDDGPLRGIPFGAKDVFETRGMATEYGSPLYRGRKGESDAVLITDLRRAGAILLGKTQTAAFASFDPAPTRNPRWPGRTPGGSSSGSAAAVAAGMVPFALGTQTLGSILRPASYCGICGFKPTYGRVAMDGVLPFAPSLDTPGFFTQTAADMQALCLRNAATPVAPHPFTPPPFWPDLVAAALLINDYEGARTHAERYREFGERLGTRLAALVRRGLEIPESDYRAAQALVTQTRAEFRSIFAQHPVLQTPAAAGPPPPGLGSTGDPSPNAPWTALGVPAICVPVPGSAIGTQLTAAWDQDDLLLASAAAA